MENNLFKIIYGLRDSVKAELHTHVQSGTLFMKTKNP